MHRAGGVGPRLFERELKEPRIRLLHSPLMRIQHMVEPLGQVDAIEQVTQPAIGVRDDHEAQPAVAQRGQRRGDIRLDVLP